MRTGRPRKPQRLKVVQGTFRNDRAVENEWTPAASRPTCPRELGPLARKEFRRLCRELSPILTKADAGHLAAYCEAYGDFLEAKALCSTKDGQDRKVIKTANGNLVENPYYSIKKRSMELMHKFGAELGMSPVARTHIKAGKKDAEDDFEKFLRQKA